MRYSAHLAFFSMLICVLAKDIAAQTVETVLVDTLIADYLALDKNTGDLYTTNYRHVSRISPDGTIEVVADATVFVTGLGVSDSGELYFSDSGLFTANPIGSIYKVDMDGNVAEFASGFQDIVGIWMSDSGDGFYTQSYGGTIYFVAFDGTVTQIRGHLPVSMTDIVQDEAGNLYIAYFNFGRVDKIAPDGTITELASIPSWLGYITYANGFIYGTGWQSHKIYKIDIATQEVFVVAGSGDAGMVDGDAATAQFNEPNGIVASVTGDTLYVTDIKSNALRRIVGATAVSVDDLVEETVDAGLGTSFPNPFTSSTTIPYTVNKSSHVSLRVFDLLGREVGVLVDGFQQAGTHSVQWDASSLPGGVYLYRLKSDDVVSTRQMVLIGSR